MNHKLFHTIKGANNRIVYSKYNNANIYSKFKNVPPQISITGCPKNNERNLDLWENLERNEIFDINETIQGE